MSFDPKAIASRLYRASSRGRFIQHGVRCFPHVRCFPRMVWVNRASRWPLFYSKSCALIYATNPPPYRNRAGGAEPPTSAALVSEAMGIFDKTEHAMPCYRLALTAHEFGSLVSGKGSISSFLRASPSSETKSHEKPDSSAQREISSSVANETLVVASKTQDERCTNAERKNHEIETERGNSPPSHACSNESEEICSQCGEILPIESLREHHDFHYAQGLQEQYTRELDIQREMAAGTSNRSISNKRGRNDESKRGAQSVGGRGKSGRLSNDSSTSRIDSFFKPA